MSGQLGAQFRTVDGRQVSVSRDPLSDDVTIRVKGRDPATITLGSYDALKLQLLLNREDE